MGFGFGFDFDLGFFIFLCSSSCFKFTPSLSESPPNSITADQLALSEFKNQITNPDTILANNWTSDTSVCSWIGVSCSPAVGPRRRVISLILPGLNLRGPISPSIGNLSSLSTLDLSNNSFHGSLPDNLVLLPRLKRFNLSGNHFAGPIPPSLFNLSSLLSLDLSNNNLTGEFPPTLCRSFDLTTLDLSYNNLTGKIPPDIGCLSKLERLYFTDNRVSGTIPPSLGNVSTLRLLGCVGNRIHGRLPRELGRLPNLEMLGFDYNNLTGKIPPEIFNISSLVYIALTDNNLSGRLPVTAGIRLPNLQGIYLADNTLTGDIPPYITNASRLKELELSYNMFDGIVPSNLGDLRDLVFVNLGGNRLRNEPGKSELRFVDTMVECRKLQFLIVGNNPLDGTLPDSVTNLSTSVEMFNIENGRVRGRIPAGIGNMTRMTALLLNGNRLTGEIPTEIGYLKQLQRLYLNRNMLRGRIPVELCDLVWLGYLVLSENDLSGSLPSCVGNLRRLQRLFLEYNRFASSLPSSLWEIRTLLFLNMSNNLLQGELPEAIGNLVTVQEIDLSNNRLSSVIPSRFGELVDLRYLSLSNNSFNGSIPSSFGDLTGLESLDLSLNKLSGAIPSSLANLRYLRDINLSYNDLLGEIPAGGVFSNSSPRSFEGNGGLCGDVSLQVPRCRSNKSSKGSKSRSRVISIVVPVVISMTIVMFLLFCWIRKKRRRVKQGNPEHVAIRPHQIISYKEILRATDGFNDANLLGIGSSGSVYKAVLRDQTVVAVKVLNMIEEETLRRRFDAECEALRRIRHRNLVKVITTCSNGDDLRAIVLEFMPNGSLDCSLHKQDCVLDLVARLEIMLDVAMAIEYLHHSGDSPVVHCDLKPANVLLDSEMVARVSDFGISKILSENKSIVRTRTLGTLGYIAPEYGSDGTVSTAGDVYSYGVMVMEVLTRRRPTDDLFDDNRSLRQWVRAAYPDSLREILDSDLFLQDEGELNVQRDECLLSAVELSLDCTEEAAGDRIDIYEAVVRLRKIKHKFLHGKKET
ncbi:receptor kinase-like protein Xa21 [Andrographis paniculata]|uniref:receptor kinase-like protein Xa21 n=1 Tax=Andrographis paniculata TaxID=175694 RepID=UPI0021E8829F|nr:receptor kinase-like protein Xa21 [Andrographis paniculata]